MARTLKSETAAAAAVNEDTSPGTTPAPRRSLGSPFSGNELDTPASKSSLSFSISSTPEDTPGQIGRLRIVSPVTLQHKPSLTMRPGEMLPKRSGKSVAVGLQKTFSSSKRLQQAFGIQETSTPFKAPPSIPSDICQAYEEGLEEYGLGIVTEEQEQEQGPEDSGYAEGTNETHEQGPGTNSHNFLEIDARNQESGGEVGGLYSKWLADSLGPLAGNERAVTENGNSALPTLQGEVDSGQESATGVPSQSLGIPYIQQSTEPNLPRDSWFRRRAAVLRRPSRTFNTPPNSYDDDPDLQNTTIRLPRRMVSDSPAFTFSPFGSMPSFGTSSSVYPYQNQSPTTFFSTLFKEPPAFPTIVVTPTSPGSSRKRHNNDPEDSLLDMTSHTAPLPNELRPAKKKIREESVNIGLPVLPLFASASWEIPFPGNSEGMSYNLLKWLSTMLNLYSTINNPCLMAVHPMFPYPPIEPVHVPLVSASFWDTRVEPHKELWFIGPGDVELLSYNEVDTFSERRDVASDNQKRPNRFREILKNLEARKAKIQNQAPTGDGRWCFIVIRGHQEQDHSRTRSFASEPKHQDEEVAPFVVIAFPKSAMTQSTECLHMLYPDLDESHPETDEPPTSLPQLQPHAEHFFSRPVLNHKFRKSSIGKFTPHLRRSSTNLTSPNLQTQVPIPPLPFQQATEKKGEPWTLRRTILWFGKAGNVPLIEGYRTDVLRWRPFLEAVGRGQGKIVMFCETDQ